MVENDMNKSIEMSKCLSPINDIAFKKIFMDVSRLKSFLNSILNHAESDLQITEAKFIPPEVLLGNKTTDAQNIFHFKCKDQTGSDFIIQIQNKVRPGLLKRIQYFAGLSLSSQLEQNRPLMPVLTVVISQRTLFPEPVKCISYHAVMNEANHKHILKGMSFLIIELEKFKKAASELKTLEDCWLYFLSQHNAEPSHSISDKSLLEAYETIKAANFSDLELEEYHKAKQLEESEVLEMNKSPKNI